MKLIRLSLCNFRQFYSEQVINFSTESNKNVTVIHGENGAGKTALLNAFKWVLYEEVDFDTGIDNIINERAIAEANNNEEINAYINLVFSHDNKKYTVRREIFCKKQSGLKCSKVGGSVMELSWIDENGEHHNSPNPVTHINQILPNKLHTYFFFNGERIENLAKLDASPEINRAIKSVMGLEIVDRAKRHMSKYVIGRMKKTLKENSTSELSSLIEKDNEISTKINDITNDIELEKENIRHYKSDISDINKRLSEISEAAEYQKQRERIEQEIADWKEKLIESKHERMQYLSKYGFLVFTNNLINRASKLLEEKRKKGELPSLIKSQFVNDLLSSGTCICGRELEKDSSYYKNVASFKTSVTPDDVEDAFIKTSGAVNAIPTAKAEFIERIKLYIKQEKEYGSEIKKRYGELDQISHDLTHHDIEDISSLNERRENIRSEIESKTMLIGSLDNQLKQLSKQLDDIQKQRKVLDIKDKKSKQAEQKLATAEEVKRVIEELYESLSDRVRVDLSKRVNETFNNIIRKPYWAEISNDYTLEIYKKINDEKHLVSDKSTGESQIASLSFIGSLIDLAKERHVSDAEYYKGGLYPIVMDSPYGSLDPEYGGKVAEAIPNLAEQVVLMATNKQWLGTVDNAINRRTGEHYTLIYHTTSAHVETNTTSVVAGSDYEYTKIEEGYYE